MRWFRVMQRCAGWAAMLGFLSCLSLTGCGDSGDIPVPVSGHVTLDGEPQADVVVQFQLTSGSGLGSIGLTDAQGRYELKQVGGPKGKLGTLPGTYRITFESAVPPAAGDGGAAAPPRNLLPASVNRKSHTFTVPAQGTDKADFVLTSK